MMGQAILALFVAAAVAKPVPAKPDAPEPSRTPKGIQATPQSFCGVSADGPADFERKVGGSRKFALAAADAQTRTYVSRELLQVWSFAIPGNPHYPFAICRDVSQDGDQVKTMVHLSCGADVKKCEAAYKQVQTADGEADTLIDGLLK